MMKGIEQASDYKEELVHKCLACLQPADSKKRTDFEEAAKCAIALGNDSLHLKYCRGPLWFNLDRSHVETNKSQRKRGGFANDKRMELFKTILTNRPTTQAEKRDTSYMGRFTFKTLTTFGRI